MIRTIEIWYDGKTHREYITHDGDLKSAKERHKDFIESNRTGVITDVSFFDKDGDKIESKCYSLKLKNGKWFKI